MGLVKGLKIQKVDQSDSKPSVPLGRKRDNAVDERILESTTEILAEVGYDNMTMDMVVARAKAGKASVYRRWSSKSDLVRDVLSWMNRNSLELDGLPETGAIRSDLLAVLRPHSAAESDRKFRVLAGLGSFLSHDMGQTATGHFELFQPWMEVNRALLRRAIDRGELPPQADVEKALQVIASMAAYRGLIQHEPFDSEFFGSLIDGIVLPALKNPPPSP
jgi:AcrR family transcriptional regulator